MQHWYGLRQHRRVSLGLRTFTAIPDSASVCPSTTPGISCERPIRSTLVSFIPLFGSSPP
jgi:hypothetical protein